MPTLSSSTEQAIETQDLRKVFGSRVAVGGLSLTVGRGEIFGFLGPNGAGKSTSIKMLLGLVKPTGGRAFILGAPSNDTAVRRRIGFLPEDFRFYDWLTAAELVDLHGRLCGVTSAKRRDRVAEVIDLVGLTPHRDRRLRGFSKGMLQRLGLAQAIVHEPDIIFLDEPTSGLDPIGRRMVRDVLKMQRARGATVFLNSHLLSEIEITCDRVVFIRDGEVVATHNLGEAAQAATGVEIRATKLLPEAIAGLNQWGSDVHRDGDRVTVMARSSDVLPDIVRHLVASGADVLAFTPQRASLEDLFLRIMGEDKGL